MDTALRQDFIEGMSRAATFVAVVTTDGAAGRHGVTVSSMTSVSADGDHPSLLICVHHDSPAATAILQNAAFCANLLGERQQRLADLFAGRDGGDRADRFDRCDWSLAGAGQPRLAEAAAAFDCTLATSLLWESHYVMVGKVQAVALSPDPGVLLYGQRGYRKAVQFDGD